MVPCAASAASGGGGVTPVPDSGRPAEAIAALECRLLATPRSRFPEQHAVAAYRLAMAYAELPAADMALNRRRALAHFLEAGDIFAELGMVIEEARARGSSGSMHRALGETGAAEEHLVAALRLLDDALDAPGTAGRARAVTGEIANNLGLLYSESGRFDEADRAFALAMESFDRSDVDGRRGWASACVNRGLAAAMRGDAAGLQAASGFYRRVLHEVQTTEAPYQHAMAWHGLGTIEMASLRALGRTSSDMEEQSMAPPPGADGLGASPSGGGVDETACLARAEQAFDEARQRFPPHMFPYQYALSCYNLSEVHQRRNDVQSLRRAVAFLEDALAVLDPRWFGTLRQRVMASLARAERTLVELGAPATRAEHFASMVAGCDEAERRWWLRERIARLLALPQKACDDALGALADAICRLDPPAFRAVLQGELQVLMEWPVDLQATALRAQLFAHRRLDPDAGHKADAVLDESITHALNGPQRVMVRDYLRTFGYERP
jgi:tetratricopeptide (TPR) repeat protein